MFTTVLNRRAPTRDTEMGNGENNSSLRLFVVLNVG